MKLKAITMIGLAAIALASCKESADTGNSSAASGPAPAAIPAPNGSDWTQTVSETPAGGFLVGNPAAKVKVVEYGSMTCSHCADFSKNGMPALLETYVKSGQVNLEFRNFVRDPADIAAAILARCGGATPFYQITDQMFAAQGDWIGKLQQMTPADNQALNGLSPALRTAALAEKAGLVEFVRLRGVPQDKAQACLADPAALQKLVGMAETAVKDYKISGTPAFLIDGELVEALEWSKLEPMIRAKL